MCVCVCVCDEGHLHWGVVGWGGGGGGGQILHYLACQLCSLPVEAILSKVQEAGFTVSLSKETHLTKEMAEQLYTEQRGKEFFNELTDMMSR